MEPIETLWEAPVDADEPKLRRGGLLPPRLRELHPGPLSIGLRDDRPTVIANLAATLDGTVALDRRGQTAPGEVSGYAEPDRFFIGLLRSLADVVLIGASTLRATRDHVWTPAGVYWPSMVGYVEWRRIAGVSSTEPILAIVSARGEINPGHPGLNAPNVPVILATTLAGDRTYRAAATTRGPRLPSSPLRIEVLDEGDTISPRALIDTFRRVGARLVLCEGGPHLLGQLVAEKLVDEIFLTVSPQLVGRDDRHQRLALIENVLLPAGPGRWGSLRSVHRSRDFLFLRYRLAGRADAAHVAEAGLGHREAAP